MLITDILIIFNRLFHKQCCVMPHLLGSSTFGCLKFFSGIMLFSCIWLPYFDSDTPGQKRTSNMGAGEAPKRKKKKQNKGVIVKSK